ncbi:S9 family peptidase [Pseudonocardia sp. HH130630-07]|uniref:S9 family peptidase n=1 Tax=Pseudonocardia sp. HH130630-07 TaxID=1690815 RepID=UPI000814E109|nr:DPP IV N-terminal domain-containing protein [Pseudonocardia sp. HH130630-07]ANY09724.1 peptidase S9 [Pseudonocardia sp. HH130630-07]
MIAPAPLTDADYARAEQMLAPYRARLIPDAAVVPQWSADGSRFWYRSGSCHVLADPAAGSRRDAFDHERLAAALSEASGHAVTAAELPLAAPEYEVPGRGPDVLRFSAFDTRWEWSGGDGACMPIEEEPPVGPGEIASPDRAWVAFRRDGNVWVRSRDGRQEFALTDDAEPHWDYGGFLEAATKVKLPLLGMGSLLVAEWSPDSTRLITHRIDQRGLPEQVLVEAAPQDGGRPVAHHVRYPMPGDEAQATMTWHVLDVGTRRTVTAAGGPEVLTSPYTLSRRWWTGADGESVHLLHQSRDGRTLELRRLDPATGAMTTLITETGRTRVDPSPYLHVPPLVRVLDSGEILWWSQRDGWGHLYRYSAEGELLGRVTGGQWLVRRVLWVDEDRRRVWFLACGLNSDPYVRQICRVDLDGVGFVRITDDDLDHDAAAPPSGGYLLDRASTVGVAPRARVLGEDGEVLVELETPDTAALEAAGWSPPERFRSTAADGHTPIFGLLWRPHGFDPARRYPVVDHTYPGPNIHRASPAFGDLFTGEPEALAALGFAVVALDGRGTPMRGKAFLDHSHGDLGMAAALDDHVAAIRELGRRHPWLDTGRVGITGHSGGGFFTARALLTHPELFSVGVAQAGPHDFTTYLPFWVEQNHGETTGSNRPALVNTLHAANLRGRLLLIDGELDDNVLPHHSMRLVDALIEADADVDMLVVPGVEHNFTGRFHYVTRRTWDYLVRHLHGTEPPAYRLAPFPPMPDWAVDPSG